MKANKEENALLSRVYKQLLKEKRSGLFHNEQVICYVLVKLLFLFNWDMTVEKTLV